MILKAHWKGAREVNGAGTREIVAKLPPIQRMVAAMTKRTSWPPLRNDAQKPAEPLEEGLKEL